MKYYSQYRTYELFDLQQSLLGLSKSNRKEGEMVAVWAC